MQDLWFIAAVPPDKIIEKVEIHRQFAADHFQSRKALNSPPHITLFPPFGLPESVVKDLLMFMQEFVTRFQKMELGLKGFGAFKPRVIFVEVQPHPQLLDLQGSMDHLLRQQFRLIQQDEKRGFHPHMTVAHRDLDRKQFPAAWKHFRQQHFSANFLQQKIVLFRHDGSRWFTYREFLLS